MLKTVLATLILSLLTSESRNPGIKIRESLGLFGAETPRGISDVNKYGGSLSWQRTKTEYTMNWHNINELYITAATGYACFWQIMRLTRS